MGVTRERVRQIEAQAYRRVEHRPFWRELGSRLGDALRGRTGPLLVNERPAKETWFADTPATRLKQPRLKRGEPKAASMEDLLKLLDATNGESPLALRNRAMLLVLADTACPSLIPL